MIPPKSEETDDMKLLIKHHIDYLCPPLCPVYAVQEKAYR